MVSMSYLSQLFRLFALYYDFPGPHHKIYLCEGIQILQRITFHNQNIGQFSSFEGSQILFHIARTRADSRCGYNDPHRGHACFLHPLMSAVLVGVACAGCHPANKPAAAAPVSLRNSRLFVSSCNDFIQRPLGYMMYTLIIPPVFNIAARLDIFQLNRFFGMAKR